MKQLKLTLIRIADWIDAHILEHRFYWICERVGNSSWWDMPPEEVGSIKYDPESDTLNIRISSRKREVAENIEPGIIVDYDSNRNVVALEILDISEYIHDGKTFDTMDELIADLKEGIHEAITGDTIPASKLLEALEDMD